MANAQSPHLARLAVAITLLLTAVPLAGQEPLPIATLDRFVDGSLQAARIPGLALGVVRGGEVAYLQGYGVAGPDGRPMTAQTPLILGSTSKSFTALAVMQLVEAGALALDAPVTTYLPWFRTADPDASAKITVRHLLYQTSGLGTYDGRAGLADNDQGPDALEKGVREIRRAALSQPPGQKFEYSNVNYNALGLIVQAVAGMSYEDYVRTRIFQPLQMRHSAAALSDTAAIGLSTGYRSWLGWPIAFEAPFPRRATPAGLLSSSAEDMTRYLIAHLSGGTYGDGEVLSAQGIAALHAPGAEIAPGVSYGMGWAVRTEPGATTIWHDGDEPNFHSHLRLLPDESLGIVILMNVGAAGNEMAIHRLVNGVTEIVRGRTPDEPVESLSGSASRLLPLVPLIIAMLWAGLSYRSWRRWRGNRTPPRGFSQFWRLYLPLVVDVAVVAIIWVLVPIWVSTPMATIALFAPDVFTIGVGITVLTAAAAVLRVLTVWSLPQAS